MSVRKALQAVRGWMRDFWFQHKPYWGHEDASDIADDLERLDREQPGWDRDADALADDIIAFFKTAFDQEVKIEPAWQGDGFDIETDAGASFTFDIHGATRSEVALKYFEHIRSVYRFVVENRRSGSWLDGGHVYSRAEKEQARQCLAKLDAWALQHLKS